MRRTLRRAGLTTSLLMVAVTAGIPAAKAAHTVPGPAASAGTVGGFSYGEPSDQAVGAAGCGSNSAGEPSVHVSKANLAEVGSELGLAAAASCGVPPRWADRRQQPDASSSTPGSPTR